MNTKTNGQIAYEAYCAQTGWKSLVSGQPLPQWEEVKPEIKTAWEAAGWQVLLKNPRWRVGELRDEIAKLAMQGYMMGNILHDQPYQWGPNVAQLSYTMADYMLAERAHLSKPIDAKEFQTVVADRDQFKSSFENQQSTAAHLRYLLNQFHGDRCKCQHCVLVPRATPV